MSAVSASCWLTPGRGTCCGTVAHQPPRPQIGRLRASGALTVTASTVRGWRPDADQLDVELADGTRRRVGAVISCTGPDGDVRQTTDSMLAELLTSGWATAGPHGLGLRTDDDGRLLPAAGPAAPVWTLGSLRRGQLWESTAVPEIRAQAAALSGRLVAALPAERRSPSLLGGRARTTGSPASRRPLDLMGLAITANAEASAAYDDALGKVLRVEAGAEQSLRSAVAADPGFAVGYAALALLGHEGGADVDVAEACWPRTRTPSAATSANAASCTRSPRASPARPVRASERSGRTWRPTRATRWCSAPRCPPSRSPA